MWCVHMHAVLLVRFPPTPPLTSEYNFWFLLDGFHKVVSIEGGGLKVEKDEMEFAHQFFMMGHPYLLEHIKRKVRDLDMLQGYGV